MEWALLDADVYITERVKRIGGLRIDLTDIELRQGVEYPTRSQGHVLLIVGDSLRRTENHLWMWRGTGRT